MSSPITHTYDSESDIITIKIVGKINGVDINKYLVQIAKSFEGRTALYVISDYRQGQIETSPTYFLSNLHTVKETFVQYFGSFTKFCNAYLLADNENTSTRILLDQFRKITATIDSFHSEYFLDQESARQWLIDHQ